MDRSKNGKPEDPETNDPQKDGTPGWVASLPPEWRDALSNGEMGRIPERYRKMVERYARWLARQDNK